MMVPIPDAIGQSFTIVRPVNASGAVVVSVPHAGRLYPPALLAAARVPATTLQLLEDRHCDALASGLPLAGVPVIVAHVARAYLDLNRGPDDWDGDVVHDTVRPPAADRKVRSGLGLVPTRLHGHGRLWHDRLDEATMTARIAAIHVPYHQAIHLLLMAARRRFGTVVLIDLHSMPTLGAGQPEVIVGDRFGATAAPELSARLIAQCAARGVHAARNNPYAGAYTVGAHGRTGNGIHAVQIEIDRAAYLAQDGHCDSAGLARMQALVASLAGTAARWAADCCEIGALQTGQPPAIAAE